MRRQPPIIASALAPVLFIIGALVLCGAASRDLFDEIYARGHATESSLRTVTARFTETSTSSLLSTPLTSRGTLAVIRPDRIVMRYSDPEGRVLLITGDEMTLVWPSKGVHQQSNIAASRRRIDKYFVDKSPDELRRSFSIAARLAPDRSHAWEVTMTPTRSQIRQGLSRLTLWIDRSSVMLAAMRMEFPTGDSKLLVFDDVVLNGPVDPRMFAME